ncbi:diaminopimelate epimerase [Halolamina sp.]|jgi:diaminopimelate epimerase|uniref:diaminopimelate epimerase n=1 Tax=Halolamina sp. TaxID=1940283 RepID=UPI000223B889|nr:Diaminopimelate epimerase [halophilic archaeon DL31]
MSESVPFEKFDGAGNDFIVVEDASPLPDRAAFARVHCNRETGVADDETARKGADGVLFLALAADFDPAQVTMTLVQPDGSIAEMCGNGARCVAAWAADRSDATTFDIETPAGTRRAVVDGDEIAVEMGDATFAPEAVPLAGDEPLVDAELPELEGTPAAGLTVTAVNTGVPHAVVFLENVDSVDIDAVAPPIRHADVFPEGANVTFASADEGAANRTGAADEGAANRTGAADKGAANRTGAADGDSFRQRTFERGVEGETQACGTGAVAVAAAAKRLGRLPDSVEADDWVRVSPPGGDLSVAVPDDAPARLRGPAVKQFEGELPAEPTEERLAGVTDGAALGPENGAGDE